MEKIEINGAVLEYEINNEQIRIKSCRTEEAVFTLPAYISERPVTHIDKKAFLGEKELRRVVLPETVREIGDWAFAHCDSLESMALAAHEVQFGRGVFKDCYRLKEICCAGKEPYAGLLGMVPVKLDAEYLLTPAEAGEPLWLEKLDARLKILLQKPDEEGYLKQVLCGEEDLMASLDLYLERRHREKASLCYHRLLYPVGLEASQKELLENYLRENTKGCAFEAAWEILLLEHGKDADCFRIFKEAGCMNENNYEGLLEDLGEDDPEMKVWILQDMGEHRTKDFFDSLQL